MGRPPKLAPFLISLRIGSDEVFAPYARLTLAVAFLYVWLLSVGSRTIRAGLCHLVDRKDRRDLSLFQIGLRYIDRCLLHSLSFSLPLCSL